MIVNNHKNNVSSIFKYIIKSQGISQQDLASSLNISKFKLNRIINGVTLLSSDVWEQACENFNINFDAIISGIITTHAKDSDLLLNYLAPNRPTKYTYGKIAQQHTYAFRQLWGDKIFEEFCKIENVDPLLFVNANNPIDNNFILRSLQYSILRGKLNNKEQIDWYTRTASSFKEGHGKDYDNYELLNGIGRLAKIVENLNVDYERNHTYKIHDITPTSFQMSSRPNEHIFMKLYKNDPILCNFILNFSPIA
ncbi:MAG: helix-turn-helix transcriptional regulator [Bacteriovoracaceae bacterium]|nr:helix-turn-helix transcriptional regulator [Bacteriovoracaceae bacterium]